MTRDWQQTRYKKFVMPDAVFHQSIWAVRDLERMETRLKELDEEDRLMRGKSIVSDRGGNFVLHRSTEEMAVERAILAERIAGIRSALNVVPEEYRSFILSNLILRTSGKAYPGKMWKYWKQRFLYAVAKNLTMM